MSAILPLVQIDPADRKDKDGDSDSRRMGSSTPPEEASSPLHNSETLEYPSDQQHPNCLELDLWAEKEPGKAPPLLEEKSETPPPHLCDPSVHVRVVPRGSLLRTQRSSEEEEEEEEEEQVCVLANGGGALEGGSTPEHRPFLTFRSRSRAAMDREGPDEEAACEAQGDRAERGSCGCCSRSSLKGTAALAGSLLIYPCFLYGAYVFLPFDVPLMPDLSARLIYTLRCSIFATVPILMGIVVYGLARLCSSSVDPFDKRKEDVEIHLRFVTDSVHLLLLFLMNLLVLSTYLPHEVLKLLPLLTAFFALARLIYWLTFAISSTFRGFGYGLTFFPILGLLICNLYYMFVLAPDQMFSTSLSNGEQEEQSQSPRQRFWG
ncbi:transmembrane protein 79-like [Hypanus sabinus]|uniref:transmembrane protein 79-like n=1 Tax=Hypanus sabinus TaxID=79690 RepID=UPI0028C3A629|nr:transmembrane protein 79-like [Hypanus sabinus]XP_059836218.1 transmembrane protein 79-like [Hypanus sabinus]XP_059836219.1 transmembrane protein 79-like [Hypanus sabinus]